MSVRTNNIYGRITISNKTIEKCVARVANDCYGIESFVNSSWWDSFVGFFKFRRGTKGVKIRTVEDRIFIDVCVTVKFGISIKAVVEALKESIQYKVERFTGMIVNTINVKVMGVKK